MIPPEEAPPPAEVRCDSCGEELTTDDRFCQSCGAQVGGPAITEGQASRLTEPVEAQFEGVDTAGVEPMGSRAAVAPPAEKSSNSTIYTLLGLAFVLIACAYFAYDYFSTPRSPGLATTPGEQIELAQDGTTSAASSDAIDLQSQSRLDEAAPSGSPPPSTARKPATSSPRPTPPRTTQRTSPDTSQEGAAGRLDPPLSPPRAAPPAASPPPKAPSSGVLMPGGTASKRTQSPLRANTPPVKASSAAPPPKPPLQKGTIYWTGKLQKNQVIVIENEEATIGIADGDYFTGIPIDVHLPSPAVRLVERPTTQNNWKRVAFRCLRTTKQSVTINIQWNLLR